MENKTNDNSEFDEPKYFAVRNSNLFFSDIKNDSDDENIEGIVEAYSKGYSITTFNPLIQADIKQQNDQEQKQNQDSEEKDQAQEQAQEQTPKAPSSSFIQEFCYSMFYCFYVCFCCPSKQKIKLNGKNDAHFEKFRLKYESHWLWKIFRSILRIPNVFKYSIYQNRIVKIKRLLEILNEIKPEEGIETQYFALLKYGKLSVTLNYVSINSAVFAEAVDKYFAGYKDFKHKYDKERNSWMSTAFSDSDSSKRGSADIGIASNTVDNNNSDSENNNSFAIQNSTDPKIKHVNFIEVATLQVHNAVKRLTSYNASNGNNQSEDAPSDTKTMKPIHDNNNNGSKKNVVKPLEISSTQHIKYKDAFKGKKLNNETNNTNDIESGNGIKTSNTSDETLTPDKIVATGVFARTKSNRKLPSTLGLFVLEEFDLLHRVLRHEEKKIERLDVFYKVVFTLITVVFGGLVSFISSQVHLNDTNNNDNNNN